MRAELIDHLGNDLTVVNAARVSFDKESEWDEEYIEETGIYRGHYCCAGDTIRNLSSRDAKLIKYLADHNHFTPFTHCVITLRETVPIFVARQRFKHQVGFTYNEVSRRYVDDEPAFYIPEVWRKKAEDKKQGSSDDIIGEVSRTSFRVDEQCLIGTDDVYYEEYLMVCKDFYNAMIKRGVAPEQARMVLPQSMYTSYYVTGSLAAFSRLYNLRSKDDAQLEIQELAKQIDTIIRPLYPVSWSSLVD